MIGGKGYNYSNNSGAVPAERDSQFETESSLRSHSVWWRVGRGGCEDGVCRGRSMYRWGKDGISCTKWGHAREHLLCQDGQEADPVIVQPAYPEVSFPPLPGLESTLSCRSMPQRSPLYSPCARHQLTLPGSLIRPDLTTMERERERAKSASIAKWGAACAPCAVRTPPHRIASRAPLGLLQLRYSQFTGLGPQ